MQIIEEKHLLHYSDNKLMSKMEYLIISKVIRNNTQTEIKWQEKN